MEGKRHSKKLKALFLESWANFLARNREGLVCCHYKPPGGLTAAAKKAWVQSPKIFRADR